MADFFQTLAELCTPERLLQDERATGEGVSVCLIDSGIDESELRKRGQERGHAYPPFAGGVFLAQSPDPLPFTGKQSTPHGTTVADIILKIAPRVSLFSADVFGPTGTCEVDLVIKALTWAVHRWKCKIVNLSLGVVEQRLQPLQRRQQLVRAIEDAYYHDVLIVAAAHNDHPWTRSYPATHSPPLVSVDKQIFADPMHIGYALNEQIEFQGHGRGYFGPFAQEPATSWAAPHITALAARILSLNPTLKPFEVKTLLYWLRKQ